MPLTIACPMCGAKFHARENFTARAFRCPKCKTPIAVGTAPRHPTTPPIETVLIEPISPFCTPQPAPAAVPVAQVAHEEHAKECPFCGEIVLAVAKKCKHCHKIIDETSSASRRPFSLPMLVGFGVAGALLLSFGVTVGLVVSASLKSDGQPEKKKTEVAEAKLAPTERDNHEKTPPSEPNRPPDIGDVTSQTPPDNPAQKAEAEEKRRREAEVTAEAAQGNRRSRGRAETPGGARPGLYQGSGGPS